MRLAQIRETAARWIAEPLMPILSKSRLKPNFLTLFGLAINMAAATVIAMGHLFFGGFLILFSGLFDLLDGALARFTNQTSRFGAVLDSTVDRISEAVLFLGLLVLYVGRESTLEIWLIFLTLVGSFLISYIRARAEGLGLECRIGLFTRAERVIVLALGLLLNQVSIALMALVVLTFGTAGQRLVYIWRQTKGS